MVRKIACAASLVLTLLVPGGAAYACEGADCPAPTKVKPLDIMKFMREQAASTRVGERRARHSSKTASKAAAKPRRADHRAVAARPKPKPMPTTAAAAFASQGDPTVPVVASGEFNAIDGAAPATVFASPASPFPFPETMGAAPAVEPPVQLVAAAELNDIDRKADDAAPVEAAPTPIVVPAKFEAPAKAEATPAPTQVSWLQWLWSAVTGTFAALLAAVRQLVHV